MILIMLVILLRNLISNEIVLRFLFVWELSEVE